MLRRSLVLSVVLAVVAGALGFAAPAHAAPVSPKLQIFVDSWNQAPTREYGTFVPITVQTEATNGFDGVPGSYVISRNGVRTSSGWSSRGTFGAALQPEDGAGTYVFEFEFVPDDLSTYLAETKSVTIVRPKTSSTLDLGTPVTDVRAGGSWTLPATSSANVRLAVRSGSTAGACVVRGRRVDFTSAGTCTIDVTAPEDANHLAGTPQAVTFTVTQTPTVTEAEWSVPAARPLEEVTLEVALLAGGQAVPGTAEVWLEDELQTTLDLDDGTATWPSSFARVGTLDFEVRATPYDAAYAPSTGHASLLLARPPAEISAAPASMYVGDTWTPTSTADGPVEVSSRTPSVCSVASRRVTALATGTCEVESEHHGDAFYDQASRVDRIPVARVPVTMTDSVVVAPDGTARVTVVFSSPRGVPQGRTTLELDSVWAQPLTVVDGRVEMTVPWRVQPGYELEVRSDFVPATSSRWALRGASSRWVVAMAEQPVTLAPPAAARVGGAWTPEIGWAYPERPSSWTATGACEREGARVRFREVGTCTVEAVAPADPAGWLEGRAEVGFAVLAATQTFSANPSPAYVGDPWEPTASAGGAVTATSTTPTVCTTDGGTVQFVAAGDCVVDLDAAAVGGTDAASTRRTVPVTRVPVTLSVVVTSLSTSMSRIVVRATSPRGTPTGAISGYLDWFELNGAALSAGAVTRTYLDSLPIGQSPLGRFSYAPTTGSRWANATFDQTVPIPKVVQAVTVSAPPADARVGQTWTPTVTFATTLLTTSWTASGACTRDGALVRFTAIGDCTVSAQQAGDANHAPGSAERNFAVAGVARTFTATPSPSYAGDTWTPAVSGPGAVSASSSTPTTCTADGGTVTFLPSGGICEVTLSVPAIDEHDAGAEVRTIVVSKVPMRSITTTGVRRGSEHTVSLTLASDRGTPTGVVSVRLNGDRHDDIPLVDGTAVVSLSTDGPLPDDYTLWVSYVAPDGTPWATVTTAVSGRFLDEQPVSISDPPATARYGGTWTPTFDWAETGQPTSWTATGTCAREDDLIRFTGVGDCTVTAVQEGDPQEYVEGRAEVVVPVLKALQPITLGTAAPAPAHVGQRWTPGATGGTSGHPVRLSAGPSEVCERVGTAVEFRTAGTCAVGFDQDGDADHEPGELSFDVEVERVPVAITLGTDDLAVGAEGTLEVGASAGDEVVPGEVTVEGGGISVSGSVGTGPAELPVTFARAGTHRLTVTFEPTDTTTYAEGTEQVDVVVAKGAQTINLTGQSPQTALVGGSWLPSVTGGGSDEPVTFVAAGACERGGIQVRFTAAGTCTVAFDQAGTADWLPAPTVTTTTEVGLVPVEVTVTAPDDARVGSATALDVVSSAPGTVEVVVDGQTVRGTGPTLPVTFTKAGERTAEVSFTPADPATHQSYATRTVLTVAKGVQQLALGEAAPATGRAGGSWTPAATGGDSGSPVQVSAAPEAICTAASGTVSFVTAGDCEVTLTQAGSADYDAAPALRRTVWVERRTPTLGVELPAGARVGELAAVTVRSDEAGTVRFELDDEVVGDPVTVTDGVAVMTLRPTAAGERRVTATFVPGAPGAVAGAEREVTLDVGRARTGTVVTVGAEGLTAAVTPVHAAAGVPTGVVVFTAGDRELGRVGLADGVALLDRPLDADWAGEVTASYAGDADRDASSGTVRRTLPTITATVRAVRPAVGGWYDAPVVVEFACAPGSAAVTTCPAPVEVGEGRAQTITRAVTAADGGRATVKVGDLAVDGSGPEVAVRGVRPGELVKGRAPATCRASDRGAGLASCRLVHRKAGRSWVVTATATDRVGHTTVARVRYRQSRAWELFRPAGEVGTVEPGERAWLVVLTDGARPVVTGPLGRAGQVVRANRFRGLTRWHVAVRFPDGAARGASYPVRVRGGGTSEVVRFRVG